MTVLLNRRTPRHAVVAASVVVLLACAPAAADHPSSALGTSTGGPINTLGATTLEQGKVAASVRVDYRDLDRFSDAELATFGESDRHVDSVDRVVAAFLTAAYGATDDLTLGATLPYHFQDDIRASHHDEDSGEGEAEFEGDSSGIGDMQLFAMYRVLGDEHAALQASLLVGLALPTGRDRERSVEGERFELEHQPGSGSWDPIFGASLSRALGDWSLHAGLTYLLVTEGSQDTDLGDHLGYDFAAVYRLLGSRETHEPGHADDHHDDSDHAEDAPGWSIDAMLELNGMWEGRHDVAGATDPDSGGNVIYVAPGLRIAPSRAWSAFVSVGFPVVQDLGGDNHESDLRITTGISAAF